MGKLPFYVSTAKPQPGQPVLARTGGNAFSETASGLAGVGDTIIKAQRTREAAEAGNELAQIKLDWTQKAVELQNSPDAGKPGFADNLQREFDRDVEKRLRRFSPDAQAYLRERATNFKTALASDAMGLEANTRARKIGSDVQEAINKQINAVRSNPDLMQSAIEELTGTINAAPVPAQYKAKWIADMRSAAGAARVTAIIDRNPVSALKALQAGEYDAVLDPSQKNALINEAEREQRIREAEARRREAEARAAKAAEAAVVERDRVVFATELEVRARNGGSSIEEIDALWGGGKGILKPEEWKRIRAVQESANEKQGKANEARALVGAALSSGAPVLDYQNKDHRAAVDSYYVEMASAPAFNDPDAAAAATVDYSARVGMIPESVQAGMRTALRSGSDDQIIRASDLFGRFQERNPQLLNDFGQDEIAMAALVQSQIKGGADPGTAVAFARKAMDVPEEVRNTRQKALAADKQKVVEAARKRLMSEFTGTFTITPEMPDEAAADFERGFRFHYGLTGDSEAATTAAIADFKRVWSPSRINGDKRLMRYAPEAYYDIGGTDYIREQLNADLRELFGPEAQKAADATNPRLAGDTKPAPWKYIPNADTLREATPEEVARAKERAAERVLDENIGRVRVISDGKTAREAATGRPSYALMRIDDAGRIVPVLRDGTPQRFRPDVQKRATEVIQDTTEEAARLREATRLKNQPGRGIPSIMREMGVAYPGADAPPLRIEVTDPIQPQDEPAP